MQKQLPDTGYKIRDPQGIHYITFTVVGWIDLFSRAVYKEILIDSLKHCKKEKGLVVHAYVIMSNHMHLIVSTEGEKLEDIIRDYKKFTSKAVVKEIKEGRESRKEWILKLLEEYAINNKTRGQYQLWQKGYHPIELNTNSLIDQKLEYIHENPVKDGYVYRAEDYVYSSAIDYTGEKGMLQVDYL